MLNLKSNLYGIVCGGNIKCKYRSSCCYNNSQYAKYLNSYTSSLDTRHSKCYMFRVLPMYSTGLFVTVTVLIFLFTGFLDASAHEYNTGRYYNVVQSVNAMSRSDLREQFGLSEPIMVTVALSKTAGVDGDLFETSFDSFDYEVEEAMINQLKENVVQKTFPKTGDIETVFTQRGTYTEEDIYVLNKIVQAESGGEPYGGKLSVANVILNRHHKYGGTIRDVVFANNQFSPTANGSFERAVPSKETIRAVQDAINGHDNSNGAMYFLNEKIASSKWISNNRTYSHMIANHTFYK